MSEGKVSSSRAPVTSPRTESKDDSLAGGSASNAWFTCRYMAKSTVDSKGTEVGNGYHNRFIHEGAVYAKEHITSTYPPVPTRSSEAPPPSW